MADIAKGTSGQPAFEPCKLQECGLTGVPEEWQPVVHVHQPCEGLYITCLNGRPGTQWAFRSEGASAFSMNMLLEGRMQTAFDDGSVLDAGAGSVTLMASGEYAAGWNVLDGKAESAFRMVNIHLPQQHMNRLIGLAMDELRTRMHTKFASQQHIDASLGVMAASGNLRRVAGDLLGFACTYPGPCLSRDLYLRAKAFEALACFLQENLAEHEPSLPVPADRPRLIEARALLERCHGNEWSVQLLARTVGLNEKRLQSGFQALFGCSVHACLTHIRINAAIAMLRSGASVTETAGAVGFSSLSHFSRVFRTQTGLAPKQCAQGLVRQGRSEPGTHPLIRM